jgi:hypothetical protein
VDQDAPDNELRPGDPPAKLIETFVEAREGLREGLSVVVEDVMGNSPRCCRASSHGRSPSSLPRA